MPEGYIAVCGIGAKVDGLKWESENTLRIGRQANLEVVIRDTSVDKLHAEIKFQGQRWMLKALAQSEFYPTYLNGRLIGSRAEQIKLNDLIQVGSIRMRVACLSAEKVEHTTGVVEPDASAPDVADITKTQPKARSPLPAWAADTPARASDPSVRTPVPGMTQPGVIVMTGMHRSLNPELFAAPTASPQPEMQVLQVQASTAHSWDQALDMAASVMSARPDGGRTLLSLLKANHHVVNHSNLDDLLAGILVDVRDSLKAQRASILLAHPVSGQLELKATLGPNRPNATKKGFSRTIAERSFSQGESLLCRDIKSEHDIHAAQSMLLGTMSSVICAVLRTPRKRLGVLHIDRGPMDEPFNETDLYLADAVAANMSIGIECAQLVASQSEHFLNTVTTLARAVEMRDQYTGDHTRRVTALSLLIADELKLAPAEKHQIQIGAPLHDVGKIGVDDAILRKPGKLTDGEFEHMKSHTVKGAEMLRGFAGLENLIPIIRSHHERWDGTGYPDKIGRDSIAMTARIVAVADTFDAMTSHRPYRPAFPPQLAFLELVSKAGTHFDPQIVHAFFRLRPKVEEILRKNNE